MTSAPSRPRPVDVSPFAAVPRIVLVPALLGLALLVLPLAGLLTRVEWATLAADITAAPALDALRLSLVTGLAATAACAVLGIPLALVIARAGDRGARLLRAIVTVPLVLPPMVGGMALLFLFGRSGVLGPALQAWGVTLPFSTAAVVIAQAFVAMPFLVLSVEGALRAAGTDYELTAATLGASRWTILRRVTLPLAAPGIVSGVVLCFARALGEFGATALFAGNAAGSTRTMPLAIYTAFNGSGVSQGTAVALSLMLLAVAVVVMFLVRGWKPGAAR